MELKLNFQAIIGRIINEKNVKNATSKYKHSKTMSQFVFNELDGEYDSENPQKLIWKEKYSDNTSKKEYSF